MTVERAAAALEITHWFTYRALSGLPVVLWLTASICLHGGGQIRRGQDKIMANSSTATNNLLFDLPLYEFEFTRFFFSVYSNDLEMFRNNTRISLLLYTLELHRSLILIFFFKHLSNLVQSSPAASHKMNLFQLVFNTFYCMTDHRLHLLSYLL